MFGRENIALVFRWKLFAVVKSEFQRRVVRVEDYVWRNDFVSQLGMLARVARILVATHVPPRPAVETAVLHMGDVIGNEVVTESVALIHRTPQLAGLRIHGQAYTVADTV